MSSKHLTNIDMFHTGVPVALCQKVIHPARIQLAKFAGSQEQARSLAEPNELTNKCGKYVPHDPVKIMS